MKRMKNLLGVLFSAMVFVLVPMYGSAHPPTGDPYYKKNYLVNKVFIADAILDTATGFIYFGLLKPYEYYGRCAVPADMVVKYVAYPLPAAYTLVDSKWHFLAVDYETPATSISFTLDGSCRNHSSKETFIKVPYSKKENAHLVEDLVVHFSSTQARSGWAATIRKEIGGMTEKKTAEIKAQGGGDIQLRVR